MPEYIAYTNEPGCLPDDMPLPRYDTYEEAKAALVADIDSILNGYDDSDAFDDPTYEHWCLFLNTLAGWRSPMVTYGPDGRIWGIDQVDAEPWYVNVYEVSRGYGGPEEGGWWFDTGEVIHSHEVASREAAEDLQASLRHDYPRTGRRSSVIGGEDYEVRIERTSGENYPTMRPHYE